MAAINSQSREPALIGAIGDAIGVASQLYGIKTNNQKLAVLEAEAKRDQEEKAKLSDPNSSQSLLARSIAKREGYEVPDTMSAADISPLKGYIENSQKAREARALQEVKGASLADLMGMRMDAAKEKTNLRNEEKMAALQTPFGLANTVDDAKQMKAAYEAKQNFDNKIQQMIDLREKHGGGAILNREDVQRGKQLSKDLLLEYKNMAKLGVLSQSDEKIINAIIPEDPLQYNSPLSALQGQDPTLNRLKSFQQDAGKDFQTKIQTRLRGGAPAQMGAPAAASKIQVSNGKETLLIDAADLSAAQKDGYARVR